MQGFGKQSDWFDRYLTIFYHSLVMKGKWEICIIRIIHIAFRVRVLSIFIFGQANVGSANPANGIRKCCLGETGKITGMNVYS